MNISFRNLGSTALAPVSAPRATAPLQGLDHGDGKGRGVREADEESAPSPLFVGADTVELSAAGLAAHASADLDDENGEHGGEAHGQGDAGSEGAEGGGGAAAVGVSDLSEEERAAVRELQARDAEVRAHEAAHAAAAGSLAQGGPSYEYQRGPDGVNYAVGGEVAISLGSGSTPEETLANAEQARRAANAPANPSGADRAVAARASQMAADARAEINEQASEESVEGAPGSAPSTAAGESAAAGSTDHGRERSESAVTAVGAAATQGAAFTPSVAGSSSPSGADSRATAQRSAAYSSIANSAPAADLLGALFG